MTATAASVKGMGAFAEITTRRVPVTVERECQCVNEADIYIVDRHTDADGHEHLLLWDTGAADALAIGFRFFGYTEESDYGWRDFIFAHVDPMPDKRTAMQAWLNLTEED